MARGEAPSECWTNRNLRFLNFYKEYHVNTVLGDDRGQRNREQIRKNRNEFIDPKNGAEIVPKWMQKGFTCHRNRDPTPPGAGTGNAPHFGLVPNH